MGRVAIVRKVFVRLARRFVQADPGGQALRSSEHFGPAGDDAHPLPGDSAVTLPIPRLGGQVAVGYIDGYNPPLAAAGERRTYSRNASGAVKASVWLKADGSIVLANAACEVTVAPDGSVSAENASGAFSLREDGVFEVNGATIGVDGAIESPVSVTSPLVVVDGKELKDHTHNETGSITGPNN